MTNDDEMIDVPRMSMSQSAHDAWKTSPELARAGEVIPRRKAPMAARDAGVAASGGDAFEAMGAVRRFARAVEFWVLLAMMIGVTAYGLLSAGF